MGRPLNKKYFGNRNIGTGGNQVSGNNSNNQNYADDRIGGEGVSSSPVFTPTPVVNSVYTSGAYLDKMPHITAIDPTTLPGGVQAVADVSNVEAVFAVPNNKGTGYQIGDIVVGTTGTGTKARFRVTKVRVLSVTISNQAASSQFDGGENLVWDSLVDDNWTSPTILRDVTSTGSPNYDLGAGATPYNVGTSTFGVWDGYVGGVQALAPTSLTITGGGGNGYNTRGTGDTNGGTGDNNGAGGTATFTYGIEAVEVVADYQGDYTVVDANAQAVTNVSGSGASATLDVFYGVKTITVTEKGSGYTGEEAVTFSVTTDGAEVRATGTMVLTTDSGAVGSATNQENAIVIYANTDDQDQAPAGDIIRQVSTRRYKVKTSDGTAICKLVATTTPAVKEAYIVATSASGATYYVMKLTAHRATLAAKTGDGALAGKAVQWTFGAPSGSIVNIENA